MSFTLIVSICRSERPSQEVKGSRSWRRRRGRDALPRDPRRSTSDERARCSASDGRYARRVRRCTSGTRLWTCDAGRAERVYDQRRCTRGPIGRLTADHGSRRTSAIRGSPSDGHVRCTASDGRGTQARPALPVWNASVDVLRRTRRNAYTIRGAAPDVNHRTSYRGSRGSASLPRLRTPNAERRTLNALRLFSYHLANFSHYGFIRIADRK